MSVAMTSGADAAVFDALVRMVVPMRREFGLALDVQQARRDTAYAQAVIERALTSRVQRLRDHALLLQRHWGGPGARGSVVPAAPAAAQATAQTNAQADGAALKRRAQAAARALIDRVGPDGEPLALRLEAAADEAALAERLQLACGFVQRRCGVEAARAFAARVALPAA